MFIVQQSRKQGRFVHRSGILEKNRRLLEKNLIFFILYILDFVEILYLKDDFFGGYFGCQPWFLVSDVHFSDNFFAFLTWTYWIHYLDSYYRPDIRQNYSQDIRGMQCNSDATLTLHLHHPSSVRSNKLSMFPIQDSL